MDRVHRCVQLTDLPDEILVLILKKLNNVEVLYSSIGVNIRLDQIAIDPIFTEHLPLITRSSNGFINSLDDSMLDRFCTEILPRIHCNIKWLALEPSYIERLFLTLDYSNLHSLSLFNIESETAIRLLADDTHFDRIFKNQITTLTITLAEYKIHASTLDVMDTVCSHVLIKFRNLTCLKFHPYSDIYVNSIERLSFKTREIPFFSPNLLKLHINVEFFRDCLYLLDGRFEQLHTLEVYVHYLIPRSTAILKQKELIHLKYFSFTSNQETEYYEDSIVPLLHRMANLEELSLYLVMDRAGGHSSFLNGNDLKKDIINHLPKLNQFLFSIHQSLFVKYSNHFPSNKDIQHTLKGLEDYHIVSYVDHFPRENIAQCHMYTYPCKMKYYHRLTNRFPGGLFKFVNDVLLFDERPFTYEVFRLIAEAFPFLQRLTIENRSKQKRKRSKKSKFITSIQFPHMTHLDLAEAHMDYVELFLDHTKFSLLNSIELYVEYRSLQRVTQNFTRDTTRINCAQVKKLLICGQSNISTHLIKTYFPHVESIT